MAKFSLARRKIRETWREAVAARAGALGRQAACLESFEAYLAAGRQDFEAAFSALRDHGGLWSIEGPEDPFSTNVSVQEGA
jgi:hypothetical protein